MVNEFKRVAFGPDFRVLRGYFLKGFVVPYSNKAPNDGTAAVAFCVSGELTGGDINGPTDPAAPFGVGVVMHPTVNVNEPKNISMSESSDYICISPRDEQTHRMVGQTVSVSAGDHVELPEGHYLFVCTGQVEGRHEANALLHAESTKVLNVTQEGLLVIFSCKEQV